MRPLFSFFQFLISCVSMQCRETNGGFLLVLEGLPNASADFEPCPPEYDVTYCATDCSHVLHK